MIDPIQRLPPSPRVAPRGAVPRLEVFRADPAESFTASGMAPPVSLPVSSKAPPSPAPIILAPPSLLSMVEESLGSDKHGVMADMMGRECLYLSSYPYKEGGEEVRQGVLGRYQSPVVSADYVNASVVEFASSRGLSLQQIPPSLQGQPFDSNSAAALKAELSKQVDQYFASASGSQNPLKADLSRGQAERFIDLIGECQAEGSVGKVSAADVYRLASQNLALLAQQDRASSEITFGEHGVRHLVGHNIRVCETLADQLQGQGVGVSAKDRLILHQAMLLHDMGYAAENVRGAMAREGIQGQDQGHPLLAGRYVRERLQQDGDPLNAIFSPDDLRLMHRCVMYHDMDSQGKPGIDFAMSPQPSADERQRNLESMTRLADNSHALDDKLTDVLYRHPAALKTMRQIKTAAEIGDEAKVESLKEGLRRDIDGRSDMSSEDKQGLKMAVGYMNASEYQFSTQRMIGGKPTFAIDAQGQVTITLRESPIHKQIAQIGGQAELALLESYVSDLTGQKPEVNRNTRTIEGGNVRFELLPSDQLNDYQRLVADTVLNDQGFRRWAVSDASAGKTQKALSQLLESQATMSDQQICSQAAVFLDDVGASRPQIVAALQQQLETVKQQRGQVLDAAT